MGYLPFLFPGIWDISCFSSKKYCSDIYEDIDLFKHQINDNKLHTYSKIDDSFCLQSYLSRRTTKPTTTTMPPAKTQVNMHIQPVRQEVSPFSF